MDLFNIKQVESPALSPDGKWVAYVVRSMEVKPTTKDEYEYRTHLWLAAVDGSTAPRQLTYGLSGNSSPAWSPAGDRIAFVRSVEKEKPQVYVLALAGGEAMPLTKIETGASGPQWSPDGTRILFTTSLSYAQVRDALDKANKEDKPAWSLEKPGRKANDVGNWAIKAQRSKGAKPMAD